MLLHNPGEGSALGRKTDTNSPGLCLAMVAVGVGVCTGEQRPLGAQNSAHPLALARWEMLRGGLLSWGLGSTASWVQYTQRERFPGPMGGMRERTGQQELRVRPKNKNQEAKHL